MNMMKYLFILFFTGIVFHVTAQNSTGVPFLDITPDTRGFGMGNTGVATSADAFSIYRNAAKSVFSGKKGEIAYSYTPWMRELMKDSYLHAVSGYYNIASRHSVLVGYRSFTSTKLEIYDEKGKPAGTFTPKDLSVDLGYAFAVMKNWSLSLTGRFIRTDMSAVSDDAKDDVYAFDIGTYYFHDIGNDKVSRWSVGLRFSNIGGRVDYGYDKYDLPTKMNFGGGVDFTFNEKHRVQGTVELGWRLLPADDKLFDASVGGEYTYNHLFAVRAGYHYGDEGKGDNSYATVGCGIEYWYLRGDFAWLCATSSDSALKNTWQVSVGISF